MTCHHVNARIAMSAALCPVVKTAGRDAAVQCWLGSQRLCLDQPAGHSVVQARCSTLAACTWFQGVPRWSPALAKG